MNTENDQIICEKCGKTLKPGKDTWLEYSITDGKFYLDGIPKDHESQGWFSFGSDCAKDPEFGRLYS